MTTQPPHPRATTPARSRPGPPLWPLCPAAAVSPSPLVLHWAHGDLSTATHPWSLEAPTAFSLPSTVTTALLWALPAWHRYTPASAGVSRRTRSSAIWPSSLILNLSDGVRGASSLYHCTALGAGLKSHDRTTDCSSRPTLGSSGRTSTTGMSVEGTHRVTGHRKPHAKARSPASQGSNSVAPSTHPRPQGVQSSGPCQE